MAVGLDEALAVLRERRNWLRARIAAKESVGWDTSWDERECDALSFVLDDEMDQTASVPRV